MDLGLFLLLIVFAGLGFLVVWPKIRTKVVPVANLGDESTEAVWIELKSQILVTSPYIKELVYTHLYDRSTEVLSSLMARHQHYAMGIEAKWGARALLETSAAFKEQGRQDATSKAYYRVNTKLNLVGASDELILYTCWFAYIGGQPKFLPGEVMSDLRFVRNAIDYLIRERNSMDAVFFKGFT
jgi:hypothetical protein